MNLFMRVVSWLRGTAHQRPSPPAMTAMTAMPAEASVEEALVSALLWVAPAKGGERIAIATRRGAAASEIVIHPADQSAEGRCLILLDHFASLYADADATNARLDVWVGYEKLRGELLALAGSFPRALLRREPSEVHRALREEVRLRLAQESQDAAAATATASKRMPVLRPVMTVATDASAGKVAGIGIACVTDDGRWAQHYVDSGPDATLGEILAIDLALRTFPHAQLSVLTDSKAALRILQHPDPHHPRAPLAELRRIRAARKSGRLTLTWVRGHSGHELNETADRLARAARRGVQLGQTPPQREAVAQQIVAEFLTAQAAPAA